MDNKLRQLQRTAEETKDAKDILNYWISALRAAKVPAPTVQNKLMSIWTLDPEGYLSATSFANPPRIWLAKTSLTVRYLSGFGIEECLVRRKSTLRDAELEVLKLIPRLVDDSTR